MDVYHILKAKIVNLLNTNIYIYVYDYMKKFRIELNVLV
jgi:hypothetical protein